MSTPGFKPLFPLVHNYLEKWAEQTPEKEALIQHESGWVINYKQLDEMAELYALCLIKLGVKKGDRVAAMALQSIQYVALQYACFKIGLIICPLDIRLKPHEVVRALNQITPVLFLMHGTTPLNDFHDVGKIVLEECPYVKHVLQYSFSENGPLVKGALRANDIFNLEVLAELVTDRELVSKRKKMKDSVNKSDGALIIFTTGTTGAPKPALIQHECIVAETEIFSRASVVPGQQVRRVCILPVSHVGGSTITVYTTIYSGGTNILLHLFNPEKTLAAIEKWQGNWLGGVPTMYRMIWALPNYRDYDLSSLKVVYYAGSTVDKEFLYEMAKMAPCFGTSLGMTECGGVSTYTPMPVTVEEMYGQVGRAAEDVAAITIRRPMNGDGTAGKEVPPGETGEICYHPPLVFRGYFGMPEATSNTISREGILYSGDIGYFRDLGRYKALYLKGRSKFMIKQKGYNVFPDEVASHIALLPGIAEVEVVGAKHDLYDEGVFAFVRTKPGAKVSLEEINMHCRKIAAYKRPQHVEIMREGMEFPLNKNGKVDRVALQKMAAMIITKLRQAGNWDAIKAQG